MIRLIIMCITMLMEGGCENKGESELRDPSGKNSCMKENRNLQTHAWLHLNT